MQQILGITKSTPTQKKPASLPRTKTVPRLTLNQSVFPKESSLPELKLFHNKLKPVGDREGQGNSLTERSAKPIRSLQTPGNRSVLTWKNEKMMPKTRVGKVNGLSTQKPT